MKLHLPVLLRSAVLSAFVACSAGVLSITPSAWAEDASTYTYGVWSDRITDSISLISYKEINLTTFSLTEPGAAITLPDPDAEVVISDSGSVLIHSNCYSGSGQGGGAIYSMSGQGVYVTNNKDVTFSENVANGHGGAIYNAGNMVLVKNWKLAFTQNNAMNGGGGAIANFANLQYGGETSLTMRIEENGLISFSGNTTSDKGGALANYHNMTFVKNGNIDFTGNTAGVSGGAIVNAGEVGNLQMTDNGNITFSNNSASQNGGAISGSTCSTIFHNRDVSFTDNSAGASGGAVFADSRFEVRSNSGDITFSGNSSGKDGGAIFSVRKLYTDDYETVKPEFLTQLTVGDYDSSLVISSNKNVTFSGNSAAGNGGAIFAIAETDIVENKIVSFTDNEAQGDGGAIYTPIGISLNTNEKLIFTNNKGNNGGAIYSQKGLYLSYGGEVTASGNEAMADGGVLYNAEHSNSFICGGKKVSITANKAHGKGGAIYNDGWLIIRGNDEAVFRKNIEQQVDDVRLRSIYSEGDMELSAGDAGTSLVIYDSVYAAKHISFNWGEDKKYAAGSVIFSGETTEADLAAAMKESGILTAPTEAQILASRTSELKGGADLFAGRLVVKSDAVLKASGITVRSSDVGTSVELNKGTIRSDLSFEAGTSLYLTQANIMSGTLTLAAEAGLDLSLNSDKNTPLLTLDGTMVQKGALNLMFTVPSQLDDGRYTLLSVSGFDTTNWTEGLVSISSAQGITFSDLTWKDNVLYLDYEAPLPDEPTGPVERLAFESDTVYNKRIVAGSSVQVYNASLTLTNSQNCYYGYTTLNGGALIAGADNAFGKTLVLLKKGTVRLKGYNLSRSGIQIFDTAKLVPGGGQLRSLALTTPGITDSDGTQLFGGVFNIEDSVSVKDLLVYAGVTKGGSINVSEVIDARGGVVATKLTGNASLDKYTKGKLVLAGNNSFSGDVSLREGSLEFRGASVLLGHVRMGKGTHMVLADTTTFGDLTLGGGTLTMTATASLTITGTLALESPTSLVLPYSGATINFGSLENPENLALSEFFGISDRAITLEENAIKFGAIVLPPVTQAAVVAAAPTAALAQSAWGTARAAKLFADAVRDQHQAQTASLDDQGSRSAWFSALSSFSRIGADGAKAGSDAEIYGGMVGLQFNGQKGTNAGLAVGQTWGHISPMGTSYVTQKTQHAAVYGSKAVYNKGGNSVRVAAVAAYGSTDADTTQDGHRFDWAQQSASATLRATASHAFANGTSVYGFVGTSYLATNSGNTENGSTGSVQDWQMEVGAGLQHSINKVTLYADASFAPSLVRRNPVAESGAQREGASNPGRLKLHVSAGASYRLNEHWNLNAFYGYDTATHENNHTANIGAACTF